MKPDEAYSQLYKLFLEQLHKNGTRLDDFIDTDDEEIIRLKKIVYADVKYATMLACQTTGRIPELESIIINYPIQASQYYCSNYCRFSERWTEAEPTILKGTPNSVFNYYAYSCRMNPTGYIWKEAEPILIKKMSVFHKYVLTTATANKDYEQKILSQPDNKFYAKYVYEYSKLLNTRWIEAEPILFKNLEYTAKYCLKFKIPVPEETHNKIIAEVAFSDKKSSSFKKKFIEEESKRKKEFTDYLEQLLVNEKISKKSTIEELLKLV